MTSLHKLGIEELDENSDMSMLFVSLAELKNLECLILRGFRFRSMPPLDSLNNFDGLPSLKLDGRLTELPKFPPIQCLTLVNSCLDEDPVPQLQLIPYLMSVILNNAYTDQEMVIWHQHTRELWLLRNLKLGNKVDEKSDIYSYGVVLLELLTGRMALDPSFVESIDIVEWVRRKMNSKAKAETALDLDIAGQCQHVQEEMILVLKIALLCTAKLPKERPLMRDVITMLGEEEEHLQELGVYCE